MDDKQPKEERSVGRSTRKCKASKICDFFLLISGARVAFAWRASCSTGVQSATASRSLINQTIQSIPLPCECRTTTQPGSSPPTTPTPTSVSKCAYCL